MVPTWLETIEVEVEASCVSVEVVQPAAGVWISGKQQVLFFFEPWGKF